MHDTTAIWRWSEHCLRCFWFIRFAPCPNVYFSNYRVQRPQMHMTVRHTKAVRLCQCSFCRLLLLLWCNNCLLLFGLFLKFQYGSNYKQRKPHACRNKTWQKLNVGGCAHGNCKQSYHENKYGGNNLPCGVRLLFTLCNQSSAAQSTYQNHNGKNQQQTPQQRQDDGNHRHGNSR